MKTILIQQPGKQYTIQRDGVFLKCPFKQPMIMPKPGSITGEGMMVIFDCDSCCPNFTLVEKADDRGPYVDITCGMGNSISIDEIQVPAQAADTKVNLA